MRLHRADSSTSTEVNCHAAARIINSRLRAKGYESLTAYLIDKPFVALWQAVHSLSHAFTYMDPEWEPIRDYHLLWLAWREALAQGTTELCARALLCRRWAAECIATGARAYIFQRWRSDLPLNYRPLADSIESAALRASLDPRWIPDGVDDAALIELVGCYWRDPPESGPLCFQSSMGRPVVLPLYTRPHRICL